MKKNNNFYWIGLYLLLLVGLFTISKPAFAQQEIGKVDSIVILYEREHVLNTEYTKGEQTSIDELAAEFDSIIPHHKFIASYDTILLDSIFQNAKNAIFLTKKWYKEIATSGCCMSLKCYDFVLCVKVRKKKAGQQLSSYFLKYPNIQGEDIYNVYKRNNLPAKPLSKPIVFDFIPDSIFPYIRKKHRNNKLIQLTRKKRHVKGAYTKIIVTNYRTNVSIEYIDILTGQIQRTEKFKASW